MKKIDYRSQKYDFVSIMRISLLLLITLALSPRLKGQDAHKLAAEYLQKYQSNIIDPDLITQLDRLPAGKVIAAFDPLTRDSLASVRLVGYRMIQRAGVNADTAGQDRQKAVKILAEGLNDKDAGNVGQIINFLQDFSPADFDPESRYYISQRAKASKPYQEKVILLTGYLDIDELLYDYRQMLGSAGHKSPKLIWAIQQAMARMKDTTALKTVMQQVQHFPVNDNVVYDLYPSLAYVRQKPAFDFLLNIILSDSKDCRSSNPDSEAPIICAFRIIEYVAPYIIDFPVKTNKYGDLEIDNYDQALIDVRNWIKEHMGDYELIRDKY